MKLSMWMIANKLEGFELELDIESSAPAVLKSARRAYADHCVYVQQNGADVLCIGAGGTITIKNISAGLALVIIQSIFDFYDDWDDALHEAIKSKPPNFQQAIDISTAVFQNPLVLTDANYRVLGISSQYAVDSVDEEWRSLNEEGYSSVSVVKALNLSTYDFSLPRAQIIRLGYSPKFLTDFISVPILHDRTSYGTFGVRLLESRSSRGYMQLAEHFGLTLSAAMSAAENDAPPEDRRSWLISLLDGRVISDGELAKQLKYKNWDMGDEYLLCSFRARGGERISLRVEEQIHRIFQRQTGCMCIPFKEKLVVLANLRQMPQHQLTLQLDELADTFSLIYGMSLPFSGIKPIVDYFQQTEIVARLACSKNVPGGRCDYYDYAVDDMLVTALTNKSLYTCHPDIRMLREYDAENNTEYLSTLHTFLRCERSIVKSSQQLFIHRNTLVYRIKKINELIRCDLEDAYARMYLLLSIQTLELLDTMSMV